MSNKLSLKSVLLGLVITLILGFLAIVYFPSNIKAADESCLSLPSSDNFSGTTLGNLWDLRDYNNGTTIISDGSLNLSVPGGGTQDQEGGVTSKLKICGDFDVSIEYSNFQAEAKNSGTVELVLDRFDNTYAHVSRYKNGGPDIDGFQTNVVMDGQGQWNNENWKSTDNANTSGKLRTKRIGSTIYTYVDQGFGWQLMKKFTTGFSDPAFLIVRVGSWQPDHPQVSATVKNFNITANPTVEAIDTKCAVPFTDNFTTNMSDEFKYWNNSINSTQSQASIANNMFNASITNNTLDWNSRGLWSFQNACGDFDISVDVNNFLPDVNKDEGTASFTVDAPGNVSGQSLAKSFYIEMYQNKTDHGIGTNLKNIINNQEAWLDWHGVTTTLNTAKLRLKRTGSLMESFYNIGNGWIRLGNYSGFTDDVKFQFFANSRNPDKPNVAVSFSNFIYNQANAFANITLKLKLQNITVKRSDVPVLVTITDQANQPVLSGTYNFVSDDNGVYAGTVNGIPAGTYNIKLKPQTFLTKKFTGQNLATGNFTLDFTASPFLGGDIDGENNTIDIFDYNRMISDFGSKMPSTGSPADLDKNGQVDIFDYNDLIGNFGKTGDN